MKMDITNIGITIASLVLICLAWKLVVRQRTVQSNQIKHARSAIDACSCLLKLIGNIQQHRGMSSAFLAGDSSFALRLLNKRVEIEPLIRQLNEFARIENMAIYPCLTVNDFSLFKHRWENLIGELPTLSIEKSIAAHSQVIATLINWLDSLGEVRIELPMGDALKRGLVRNYAHRLPLLTECLGQARATGSGIAAKGVCSAVARVRLMFLVTRAESLIEQACTVDDRGSLVLVAVRNFAQLTRTHMLNAQKVSVSAEKYFTEATSAIDAVFSWIHESELILAQQLANAEASGHPQLRART